MAGNDHAGVAVLLEATHRPEACLQSAVVAPDARVGGVVGTMPGGRHQLLEHAWVHRRVVGDDLDRDDLGGADRPPEELAGRLGVSARATNTSMTWPNWSTARWT